MTDLTQQQQGLLEQYYRTHAAWLMAVNHEDDVELVQEFGTGGSPSAEVNAIGTIKVSIGTTFQKVTITTTVPSISGKTLGTNNDHSLTLVIWFDAGSTFNSRTDTLGQQSGTFEIAQVQVERGPIATPFERRPIGQELALCQRYAELGTAYAAALDACLDAGFDPFHHPTNTINQGDYDRG